MTEPSGVEPTGQGALRDGSKKSASSELVRYLEQYGVSRDAGYDADLFDSEFVLYAQIDEREAAEADEEAWIGRLLDAGIRHGCWAAIGAWDLIVDVLGRRPDHPDFKTLMSVGQAFMQSLEQASPRPENP